MKHQLLPHLHTLRQVLEQHQIWEAVPPSAQALASQEPFCVDTLSATQWLQWIFLPRMHALLEAERELPRNFAITPYLEEALKNERYLADLLKPINAIETLLKS